MAVRWYPRYGLSYRDVEELLAERGIEVDHVRCFGGAAVHAVFQPNRSSGSLRIENCDRKCPSLTALPRGCGTLPGPSRSTLDRGVGSVSFFLVAEKCPNDLAAQPSLAALRAVSSSGANHQQ
jgi:hypothetical protein